MITEYHKPVLLQESIEFLHVRPGALYVDGTLGGGGHTEAILKADTSAHVLAFDADQDAVMQTAARLAKYGPRVTLVRDNFRRLRHNLLQRGVLAFDGLLLDLGVSSFQLDRSEKGFSYRFEAPLDMRMGGQSGGTAADIINGSSEQELADVFFRYGEERQSRRLARALVQSRQVSPIRTTTELARIIAGVMPERHLNKTLSRIFQALRIVVNDELENLKQVLNDGVNMMNPGARLVVIAYHSLEDRIVKEFFRYEASDEIVDPNFPKFRTPKPARLTILTRRPVEPDENETHLNPRARSAKLRAAERK